MTMYDQLTPSQKKMVDECYDPSDSYEDMLKWQANILAGRPMPEGLTDHEQAKYRNLKNELDAAGRLGYMVDVPAD